MVWDWLLESLSRKIYLGSRMLQRNKVKILFSFLVCLSFAQWLIACGGEADGEGKDTGIVLDLKRSPTFSSSERKLILEMSPVPTLPKSPSNRYADDAKAALLGQYLFYDKGLSGNKKVSCATCHAPDKEWGDGKKVSEGVKVVVRHAPTLWNVAYNRWFFWDGRADSLWAQALGPIEADKEMASSRSAVAHYISETPKLKAAYEAVFGSFPNISDTKRFPKDAKPLPKEEKDPRHLAWSQMEQKDKALVNRIYANIGKAIAAYERLLVSKDAPFDTYVTGVKEGDPKKQEAISNEAKWGLKIFLRRDSCVACHSGPNFTDLEFHNIGFGKHPSLPIEPDLGRFDGIPKVLSDPFNGLGAYSDNKTDGDHDKIRFLKSDPFETKIAMGEMKTPTLRNIAKSAPYMHDGRFKNLEEVISYYSTFGAKDPSTCLANVKAVEQPKNCKLEKTIVGHREETLLILKLSPSQTKALLAFLRTLTGKPLPSKLLRAPDKLPE